MLAEAALTQLGQQREDQLRQELELFYSELDVETCKVDIGFRSKRERLTQPNAYKVDIMDLSGDRSTTARGEHWDLWGRRFGLLRRLGVGVDLLVLHRSQQIPPHAHSRVVSGFYLLEGAVAIRHYDRIEAHNQYLIVRKAIDKELTAGEFTTNSEFHHNIHWLLGIAPLSFLFRFTATNVPLAHAASMPASDTRIYVDPTGPCDHEGLIRAPRIDEEEAHRIPAWIGASQ